MIPVLFGVKSDFSVLEPLQVSCLEVLGSLWCVLKLHDMEAWCGSFFIHCAEVLGGAEQLLFLELVNEFFFFLYSLCFLFVVQSLSRVQPFVTPWTGACQASLSFTISWSLTHVHWVGDAIQPSCPLSSPSPPAFNLASLRIFSNESALCIRWPKYWIFSFSISPSNASF